jgi:perosamine synthetase
MLTRSEKKIAFAGPWITEKELAYTRDATINGFYENYDGYAKKLEKTFTGYVGSKFGIATHCCTVALHLAGEVLGLKEGDEVICTDFSWVATAYAISYTGAKPVFVDIEPNTWTIDPDAIERAITPRSKAIMLVHSFGVPADMTRIMAIAKKHNLKVIEDAAPALGAKHKGKPVGTFGDFGCFSFQGAKLTVSGEGGIIITDNEDLFKRAKLLSSMGRTDSQAVFWSDEIGWQYTIANLTAALALAQVERVEELLEKKRSIFNWYHERLHSVPGIKFIRERAGDTANYCYPSILLEDSINVDRDKVLATLRDLNVHCRPGFPQMSKFPPYASDRRFDNPVAAQVQKRGISLASAANLDHKDVDYVCNALIEILKR